MRPRLRVVLAITFATAIGFACGGNDNNAGIGPAEVAGSWSGTTSQDKNLIFTVTSEGVSQTTLTYLLEGSRCGYTSTLLIPTAEPLKIADGHFAFGRTQAGANLFISATGKFTSAAQATGTVVVQDGQCGDTLNLTWSASKQ